MSGDFAGRVALITGAGGDLGGAAGVMLAERGAKVVAVDRNRPALERLAGSMPVGAELVTVVADVTSEAETADYVRRARAAFGRIDVFFNNAGIEGSRTGAWRPLTDLPLADFQEIIAVNARGVFLGLKHVIPVMAEGGGGAIVNTSSINGLRAARHQIAYVASKHAVRALTVSAAREWAASNIRVNAVAPGAIQGRMLRDFGAIIREYTTDSDPARPARFNPPPIPGWADPRDVAQVVLFLASDEASYVTGATYSADGGLSALY